MSALTLSAEPFQAFPFAQRPSGSAPRTSRRVGLTVTLLAHLIVLFFLFFRFNQPMETQPAPPGLKTLSAFWISTPNRAPQVTVAAAPKPIVKPRPPKPVAKATPQPPKPVAEARIAAVTPTPTVSAPQPTPAAPASDPAEAEASSAPVAAAAAVAASPAPSAGDVSNLRSSASYIDLDRLERQYARLVSRTISVNQRYPVYSKQFGEKGTAWVRVSLARDGSVLDAVVMTATGYRYLDDEAKNVIMRVGRFAPVPALLRQGQQVVVIDQPVKFDLR